MVRPGLAALAAAQPHVMGPMGGSSGPEPAAAGVLWVWGGLLGAFGLLLFWGVPVAAAALLARGRGQNLASALLWASLLGWPGLIIFWYHGSAKSCPHCRARIVAEAAHCYWCGGGTRPVPLPEFLQADGW